MVRGECWACKVFNFSIRYQDVDCSIRKLAWGKISKRMGRAGGFVVILDSYRRCGDSLDFWL